MAEGKKMHWSLAYLGITEPPPDLTAKYGSNITDLDLSYNRIFDLRFLSHFPVVSTLVLDHNLITSQVKMPYMPQLQTLWLNHNRITNLGWFVSTLTASCPNLRFLSMMNNVAAPSFFNGGSYQQYSDFRHYVISRLNKLEMLDYSPVTPAERQEAARIYGKSVKKLKRSQSMPRTSSHS